jgi:hypothetical protein
MPQHEDPCTPQGERMIKSYLQALRTQRWDDHRYYHHSRINQTLHFVSATSFLCAYLMLFFYPVAAALIGWLLAMTTRQVGHFFFEPKGYDDVNQVTHEYKDHLGALSGPPARRSDTAGCVRACQRRRRIRAAGRQDVACDRRERAAVPDGPVVLP